MKKKEKGCEGVSDSLPLSERQRKREKRHENLV